MIWATVMTIALLVVLIGPIPLWLWRLRALIKKAERDGTLDHWGGPK